MIVAAAGYASANPIVVPPASTATQGVYELFISNLPIDILLFSVLFLLVLWKLKSPLTTSPKDTNMMVAQVAIGGLAIAAIGALTDFYAFFEYHEAGGSASTGYYPVDPMTIERIVVAAIAVFVSVCAVSLAITRARPVPSLVIGATIAALNVIAWIMWEYEYISMDGEGVVVLAGILFLFVPPTLFMIAHLHKKGVRS